MQLPVVDQSSCVSPEALSDLAASIDGEVRFGRHDRLLYATDASMYQVEPLGVVVPRTTGDVVKTVSWCAAHGLGILPRGGGTSLAGQTVNRAVVIDCSAFLRGIGAVDPDLKRVDVEPGAVLDAVQRAAAVHGLRFGPEVSTSTHATLGGMIANRSAGLHSRRWGMTDAHVVGLDVVLADGSCVRLERGSARREPIVAELIRRVADVVLPLADVIDARYPRIARNVGGYALDRVLEEFRRSDGPPYDDVDLSVLFAGAEGTLGLVTGATLSLVEDPPCKLLAVLAFTDVAAALRSMAPILNSDPAAVELLDHTVLDAARDHGTYAALLDLLPACEGEPASAVLYVDWLGDTEADVAAGIEALQRTLPDTPCAVYADEEHQQQLWRLRKVGLGLILSGDEGGQPVGGLEDCAVPVEQLADFQQAFEQMLGQHGLAATYYAHASVGLLHIRPRIDLRYEGGRDLLRQLGGEATQLVMEHGGTVSGEHGDGRIRAAMTHAFYGAELVEAFGKIKAIFDPAGLLNPGNLIADPGMTEHLRLQAEGESVPAMEPGFNWSPSMSHAASACNGNGYCRRTDGGVMCPSYRATLDERHATRGRANALRLAWTGQLQDGGLQDAETLETLDLCLGCKACRYECPATVDVASLKSEYLHQSWSKSGGAPWRVRLKSNVRAINRVGSALHPLSTWLAQRGPTAWMLKRLLGVSSRRTLPAFGRSLIGWHRRRRGARSGPVVLLYPDCFTSWCEPGVGQDAITLLEAFGYRVVIPDVGCCGRTACSGGLLSVAAAQVSSSAVALEAAMRAHGAVGVVAVEPSCVTSLQQEWRELRLGDAGDPACAISEAADSVEAFLLRRWEDHPNTPTFGETTEPLSVHQHCHQKPQASLTGVFLRRCGWINARVLDTGCCGMAGAFGYESRHDALSRRIAADSLSELQDCGGAVAANGTSCRHQISDVYGREARHPVSLAAARLTS